ncbi:MAG: DUF1345 domain-containing protein, partial [Alphaproteobacteria bacterium]|nr:DUF1345 domain-containing protein [Alphaproteobacteria bacterium]
MAHALCGAADGEDEGGAEVERMEQHEWPHEDFACRHYTDCVTAPKWQSARKGEAMATGSFRDWRVFRFVVRFVVGRRRLLAASAAGLVLFALLPTEHGLALRFILAWDLTAALYIGSIMWMISHSTVEDCHDHAALNDVGDWTILILVVTAASASFVGIAVELPLLKAPGQSLVFGIVVTGLTVALSWAFTHTVFALHYANVYYRPDDDGPGGLAFPG